MAVQELVERKEVFTKSEKHEIIARCHACGKETPIDQLKQVKFSDEETDLYCPGNDPIVPCLADGFNLFVRRKD